jgi:hypothetical protein
MGEPPAGPLHIEFALTFLIEKGEVRQPRADRRLNALERAVGLLARPWRPDTRVMPATELRMSSGTLRAYRGWVKGEAGATGPVATRLQEYGATVDPSVPNGWVRLLLRRDVGVIA